MNDLTGEIKQIDLVSMVRDAGVELRTRGGRYVGICPFHTEKTPSFFVFPDNHFKCFGCGVYGDAVDFVQRLHGMEFNTALNHLGINQGPLTTTDRKKISEANRKRERRRELIGLFREWERAAVHHFSIMVRATRKAMMELTPENFNQYGDILQPLSAWEYWLDILTFGDDSEKFVLFQEHLKNGIKLIRRNQLFRPDFDFRRWLREKD